MDINKLIKLAKSYDTVGLYHEADKIMIKLAQQNDAVYVPPSQTITYYKKNPEEFFNLIYPGKFNYDPNKDPDKRYERFNYYSDKILEATNAKTLKYLQGSIDGDKKPIGDTVYSKYTLVNFINQFLQKKPNFDKNNYNQYQYNFKAGEKDAISQSQIAVIAQKDDGTPTVSFGDEKSKT